MNPFVVAMLGKPARVGFVIDFELPHFVGSTPTQVLRLWPLMMVDLVGRFVFVDDLVDSHHWSFGLHGVFGWLAVFSFRMTLWFSSFPVSASVWFWVDVGLFVFDSPLSFLVYLP